MLDYFYTGIWYMGEGRRPELTGQEAKTKRYATKIQKW